MLGFFGLFVFTLASCFADLESAFRQGVVLDSKMDYFANWH